MTRKSPARQPGGQLRIIGGQWRGRKLPFPDLDGLRPTGDRIRETLFNWLQGELHGARVLDLFAGSGALGLEALSRGAGHCTLLELQPAACAQLRANLQLLGAAGAELVQADSLDWLSRAEPAPVDLVFLDPPFSRALWQPAIDLLHGRGWLAPGAWIYVESGRNRPLAVPAHWRLHRDKVGGEVQYRLYRLD